MKACDSCEYRKYCAMSEIVNGCSRFKKDETTNEQWIRRASTEEMAECITNISFNTGYDSYDVVYRKMVEWLKQPHTPKE